MRLSTMQHPNGPLQCDEEVSFPMVTMMSYCFGLVCIFSPFLLEKATLQIIVRSSMHRFQKHSYLRALFIITCENRRAFTIVYSSTQRKAPCHTARQELRIRRSTEHFTVSATKWHD
jgi:hypothetical protein